jgi:hypothetical protein
MRISGEFPQSAYFPLGENDMNDKINATVKISLPLVKN